MCVFFSPSRLCTCSMSLCRGETLSLSNSLFLIFFFPRSLFALYLYASAKDAKKELAGGKIIEWGVS